MKKLNLFISIIATLFILSSCDNNDEATPQESPLASYHQMTEQTLSNTGLTLNLRSGEADLFAGYNKFFAELTDADGNQVTNAEVKLMPMMDMVMGEMTHSHAAPVDQPTLMEEGFFKGGINFIMPSTGETGVWTLHVTVSANDMTDEIMLPITVSDKNLTYASGQDNAQYQTIIRKEVDGTRYFVAYYFVEDKPMVGSNEIVITVHKMMPMDTMEGMEMEHNGFMPVNDLTVEFQPWMPSMGHGSSNNVNPIALGDGHYKGTVNFNMTGDWELKLKVMDGEKVLLNSMAEDATDASFYLEF
ncbi:FixH family protein [Limibacter armeniacum]|uniref:FixH family protein n=1 Tax=Limibacter armeniacum TaxID=466084 RepID=UPI002FE66E49